MYARYIPPSKNAKGSSSTKSAAATTQPAPVVVSDASQPKLANDFSYARYVPPSKPVAKPTSASKSIHYFTDEPSAVVTKRKRDAGPDCQEAEAKKPRKNGDSSSVKHGALEDTVGGEKEKKKKNRRKRKQRTQAMSDTSDDSADDDATGPKSPHRSVAQTLSPVVATAQTPPDAASGDGDVPPSNNIEIEDAHDAQASLTQPTVETGTRKPKREKKKKSKRETSRDDATEDGVQDAEATTRHKAVLERKSKSLKLATEATAHKDKDDSEDEVAEAHGLEPLPQPPVAPDDETRPSYDTLPAWLSAPIRVSHDTRTAFTDLGIAQRPSRILGEQGFSEAFAVQTAAIPLLLPTSKRRPGDVLISAATGSGKTLAYALPIVRDISAGVVTRLRALVVLPTRDLVRQAQQVFEICAQAHEAEDRKRVRIGIAVGSQSIKSEQAAFVERHSRYDPDAYQSILNEAHTPGDDAATARDPRLGPWHGDVVDFMSKVDVLICTPGRLVDHIEQTPGFSLDYVRWLVVDEADKLLAQTFQGWLDVVLAQFKHTIFGARDFPDMAYSGVRKVILSATLTRDLGLLSQLALRRPQLIVLEAIDSSNDSTHVTDSSAPVAEHGLPTSLKEFAVRVHDSNLKPLYLLDLLRGPFMHDENVNDTAPPARTSAEPESANKPDAASASSETSSDGETSSDDEDSTPLSTPSSSTLPVSLIFTKSNESALRLSRLLTILDPLLSPRINTLTSATPTHIRRRILRAFTTASSPIRLIIASDLVARGIDIPKLGHVINYDLPASVAGYVHRVGRTARAGKAGCAWTLLGDEESGWFWGKIAKNKGIQRARKVERARIAEMEEDRIQEYEAALAELGKEALAPRRKK